MQPYIEQLANYLIIDYNPTFLLGVSKFFYYFL